MTEINKYSGKPVEVHGIELTQYGDFHRAADWINRTISSLLVAYVSASDWGDVLILSGPLGVVEAPVGTIIVLDPVGEFFTLSTIAFKRMFDQVGEPVQWEGTTNTYLPKGKEGVSLLGGA